MPQPGGARANVLRIMHPQLGSGLRTCLNNPMDSIQGSTARTIGFRNVNWTI